MAWLRRLRARIRYRDFDADVRREIDAHRAMKEEELRAAGRTEAEARVEALRTLGNVTLSREDSRRIWIAPWLEGVVQDLRYGRRSLARTPGFTVTALLTLTLGIALNTSFFTLASGIFLKPWPLPDAGRVVSVASAKARVGFSASASPAEFRFLRDQARTVDLVAIEESYARLGAGAEAARVAVRHVSGNYFDALGVRLALGRGFAPAEDEPGRPAAVAVISPERWRRDFGESYGVLGRTILVNDVPFTVIGVAASGATDRSPAPDLWLPLAAIPIVNPDSEIRQRFLVDPELCCIRLAGRLRERVTHEQATAELTALHVHFKQPRDPDQAGLVVTGTAALDQPGSDTRRAVQIFGLVFLGFALLLVVACANVGNLQVARVTARNRELAIRHFIGAARARIVRQLLTEGLLLGTCAAAISLAAAFWLPPLALGVMNRPGPDVSPDWRVLALVTLLVALAIVGSGLVPALRGTGSLTLRHYGSRDAKLRLRSGFLAVQVALSALLLTGGLLLARSVMHAASADPGYAIHDVVAVSVRPPTRDLARLGEIMEGVRLALRDAGIDRPAEASTAPLDPSRRTTAVGLPEDGPDRRRSVYILDVTPGYFETLRMPVIQGGVFGAQDPLTDVMINERLARQLWTGGPALDRVLIARTGELHRVVGVVADANLSGVDVVEPTLFRRAADPAGPAVAMARGNLLLPADLALVSRVREAARSIEPNVVVSVRPLGANLVRALELPRIGAFIGLGIALLAVLLSAVALFGVFSYAVTDRTREIGIRMALGARTAHVVRLLFRQAAWPLAGGLAAGLGAAMLAAPLLRAYLFGIGPYDAIAFGAVAATLSLAAGVATIHPARRAAAVDPAVALRHE